MSALESNPFGKLAMALGKETIEALRNRLIFQTIGALVLILVGILIKDEDIKNPITDYKTSQVNSNFSQFSLPSKSNNNTFIGERLISNDKYKLFLIEKHQIKKNEVLNQYVCDEKLFSSVDEALALAASIEEAYLKEVEVRELLRIKSEQQRNVTAAENLQLQKKNAEEAEFQKKVAWKAGASKRRNIAITILTLFSLVFALIFYSNKIEKNKLFNIDSKSRRSNPDAYKIPKLILTSELDFYRKFDHNINVCMACRSYAWYYIKEKPDSECSITIRKALDKDKISKEKLEENWWQICPQFDVITHQN